MKTAICLLFLAQLFGFDYKTTATESIVKQGVLTARSFELNHEKFKDKVADRLLTIQESTMNESKKKILIEELKEEYSATLKAIEIKWALPCINFNTAKAGDGGMLASSPIAVVGPGESYFLSLRPVLIEWDVLKVEDDGSLILAANTEYDRSMLVNGNFQFSHRNIKLSEYANKNVLAGSKITIDTMAYCTGTVDGILGDKILAFTMFKRTTHNTIAKRGKAEGKKLFDDNQEKIDRIILRGK
jgi:hypothetical protein